MKKSMRYMCIFLAALMIVGVFGMLFAQLAMAEDTSSGGNTTSSNSDKSSNSSNTSSDTSSSSDDTPADNYSGSLRLYDGPYFYKANSDGDVVNEDNPDRTIKKGPVYKVVLTVIDSSVTVDNEGAIDSGSVYVSNTGGYFSTRMNSTDTFPDAEMIVLDVVGGSPKLEITFYTRFDGKGKMMELEVGYTYMDAKNNNTLQSKGTFKMRINGAVLNPDATDDSVDSYLIATPNIIVTSYNYGDKDIMAGYDFPLTITFKNTSDEIALENIIMDIKTTADLAIADGSNSIFIQNLGKGESQTKTFMITASGSIEPKPQQITVKFSYEYILNKNRKDGGREELLAVPIVQLDRFSVGEMSVPQQIYPGDNTYISIDYVNKGKTDVPNLSARLESETEGVSDSQSIGNVKAGDSGTIDFQFTVNEPGPISGKVIVTYEDARGIEKHVERPFSATVMDTGAMYPENNETEMPVIPEETGLTKTQKTMAVIGGLMVAGLTAMIIIKKAKLRRDEEQDEDI